MDYSLLLGFHYRARQNLQRGASFHESILPDKLPVLSEQGKDAIYIFICLNKLSN
jgi:1-phosphatidylinositol-4-phosphate 5-kinase